MLSLWEPRGWPLRLGGQGHLESTRQPGSLECQAKVTQRCTENEAPTHGSQPMGPTHGCFLHGLEVCSMAPSIKIKSHFPALDPHHFFKHQPEAQRSLSQFFPAPGTPPTPSPSVVRPWAAALRELQGGQEASQRLGLHF